MKIENCLVHFGRPLCVIGVADVTLKPDYCKSTRERALFVNLEKLNEKNATKSLQ